MRGTKSIILGLFAMAAAHSNVQGSPFHEKHPKKLNLGQKPYIKGKNGKRSLKK